MDIGLIGITDVKIVNDNEVINLSGVSDVDNEIDINDTDRYGKLSRDITDTDNANLQRAWNDGAQHEEVRPSAVYAGINNSGTYTHKSAKVDNSVENHASRKRIGSQGGVRENRVILNAIQEGETKESDDDRSRMSEYICSIQTTLGRIERKVDDGNAPVLESVENDREWKHISVILDRLFFILYIIIIITSLLVLFPRPNYHDHTSGAANQDESTEHP